MRSVSSTATLFLGLDAGGTQTRWALADAAGTLQREGRRGPVIDDAGGGHWIACEALRHVWRAEDEAPGAWQRSPLAASQFKQMGGSDWAHTRTRVCGATRGELCTLALALAGRVFDLRTAVQAACIAAKGGC